MWSYTLTFHHVPETATRMNVPEWNSDDSYSSGIGNRGLSFALVMTYDCHSNILITYFIFNL